MAGKPMPADQLEIRLASLVETALDRGPSLNTTTRVIAETIVDTACCRPGQSGTKVVEHMRSRLAEHGSSSSK